MDCTVSLHREQSMKAKELKIEHLKKLLLKGQLHELTWQRSLKHQNLLDFRELWCRGEL